VIATTKGLRLLFHAAPDVEAELRRLTELERECCAFAAWTVRAHGARLVLDVTADTQEGVAAVQAMFGKLHSPHHA
jgi:hypothetical protein